MCCELAGQRVRTFDRTQRVQLHSAWQHVGCSAFQREQLLLTAHPQHFERLSTGILARTANKELSQKLFEAYFGPMSRPSQP